MATDPAAEAGYEQYEIAVGRQPVASANTTYSTGAACRIWDLAPAHTVLPIVCATLVDSFPQRYIKVMGETGRRRRYPRTPVTADGICSLRDEMAETLIMGLRLTGMREFTETFRQRFGMDLLDVHGETIRKYVQHQLMAVIDERVRITDQGHVLTA
ncbi:MAG: hypothetical protein U0670_12365 [Anaerolineae bacterium]